MAVVSCSMSQYNAYDADESVPKKDQMVYMEFAVLVSCLQIKTSKFNFTFSLFQSFYEIVQSPF